MIDLQDIGRVLRERREYLKLDRSQLAARANVVSSTIKSLESSGRPTMEIFLFVCDALEIKPSTILRRAERESQ